MTKELLKNVVLYRTYSRLTERGRESWQEIVDRVLDGLIDIGKFEDEEIELMRYCLENRVAFPAGRSLWVANTNWSKNPNNFPGFYNCTSLTIESWLHLAQMMGLAMCGCGTGAVLLPENLAKLPIIKNQIKVKITGMPGEKPKDRREERTHAAITNLNEYLMIGVEHEVTPPKPLAIIRVGDSRQGWVESLLAFLSFSSDDYTDSNTDELTVEIDLSSVRAKGETLEGFGGIANPQKLHLLYPRIASILNQAKNRQLTAVEVCLLIDEAAFVVVAGGIRRSAGIRQFAFEDTDSAMAKNNLWQQDDVGTWKINPEKSALQMANHTRVCFKVPTPIECIEAVKQQVISGEGAIQYAPEAIARGNSDLLPSREEKNAFIEAYLKNEGDTFLIQKALKKNVPIDAIDVAHRLERYGLNPCVTANTWIHTENGARQVKDLIGKQTSLYVNGELFSTTSKGFWLTGVKPVFKLVTKQGYELCLTANHKLLKVTAQTQKKQYTEWVKLQDLKIGDRILLQNHRGIQPWIGEGNFDEGWLLGNLVGDGSIAKTSWNDVALLRYWGESRKEMAAYATNVLEKTVDYSARNTHGFYNKKPRKAVTSKPWILNPGNLSLQHNQISSTALATLAKKFDITRKYKMPTLAVERSSYDFYRGFLRGIFDADGSVQGNHEKGISIRLSQSNLNSLKIVQRMLTRLGIISSLFLYRREAGYRMLPSSSRELSPYHCKAQHELIISNENIYYFQELIGFQEPQKANKCQELLSGYKRRLNRERFSVSISSITSNGSEAVYDCTVPAVSQFDANGISAHNCGEILGKNFFCNLAEVHLNQHDPKNIDSQIKSFQAASLSSVCLLHQKFVDLPEFQRSRQIDPIIGVSFTGLFDFFVKLFGVSWLRWWQCDRFANWNDDRGEIEELKSSLESIELLDLELNHCQSFSEIFRVTEKAYLNLWRNAVKEQIAIYCDRNKLKRPNRYTTVQPAGTKSLLTNASCGWHPPKYLRYIRRITFSKNDPVAKTCIELGYKVTPGQADTDDRGNLLTDPFDERTSTWLVEIPLKVDWIDEIPEEIQTEFSAKAQIDLYLQVQQNYTTHNTSATFEVSENEVEEVGLRIHKAIVDNEGYISAAILGRSLNNSAFPRLPYEPISVERYETELKEIENRRTNHRDSFLEILNKYTQGWNETEGPMACDSDRCLREG